MKIKKLPYTKEIKIVSGLEFREAIVANEIRNYNTHEINIFDDHVTLSAPFYSGTHFTLVLPKTTLDNTYGEQTMKEHMYDYYLEYVIPRLLNVYREDVRNEIIEAVKEKVEEIE